MKQDWLIVLHSYKVIINESVLRYSAHLNYLEEHTYQIQKGYAKKSSTVVCDVKPCHAVGVSRLFGETYCLHYAGRRVRQVSMQRYSET